MDIFAYGSRQAAKVTVLDPSYWSSTALQVGGFAGASAVNNGNATVTYTIPNVAGTNSFFCHAVGDRTGNTQIRENSGDINFNSVNSGDITFNSVQVCK